MQADGGGSVYLRLSTRSIAQPKRHEAGWRAAALNGGYWLHEPRGTEAIAYMGAIAPEAIAAWTVLEQRRPGLGLLA